MEEAQLDLAVTSDGFKSLCRACLCDLKDNMVFNVNHTLIQKLEDFEENAKVLTIMDALKMCTSIQFNTEDNLPKYICSQCFADLTDAYRFISKCKKSNEILDIALKCKENTTFIKMEAPTFLKEAENITIKFETIKNNMMQEKQFSTLYCKQCDLPFKNLNDLIEHKKNTKHAKSKIHVCSQCPKRFLTTYQLANHIRTHTKERPYSCELCSASFGNESNLRHHRLVHTGEKSYSCKYCTKAFSRKQTLEQHLRIHTGEKPYICNHCGNAFTQLSTMKKHIRTQHDSTSTLMFSSETTQKCNVCYRQFTTDQSLKLHKERAHNEESKKFLCSICGKRYTWKYSLEIHYRIHTNEKPFKCEYCGKGFKQQSTFRSHKFTHTGETPYSCETCGKKFTQLVHMKLHKKTHHTKNNP